MANIFQLVNDNLYARITDPSTGYNTNMASGIAASYPSLTTAQNQIDWNPANGQYFLGEINPNDIEETASTKFVAGKGHYVYAMLWTDSGMDDQHIKFEQFSGEVFATVQLVYSWRKGNPVGQDFETPLNAAIDAMVATVNGQQVQGWASPIAYKGDLRVSKSPTAIGGDYWRRLLRFRLSFYVDQQ